MNNNFIYSSFFIGRRFFIVKNLYFIRVEENYIKYLKMFDNMVQDNSNIKSNKPYLRNIDTKRREKIFCSSFFTKEET